jgi:hypothetical protein
MVQRYLHLTKVKKKNEGNFPADIQICILQQNYEITNQISADNIYNLLLYRNN